MVLARFTGEDRDPNDDRITVESYHLWEDAPWTNGSRYAASLVTAVTLPSNQATRHSLYKSSTPDLKDFRPISLLQGIFALCRIGGQVDQEL